MNNRKESYKFWKPIIYKDGKLDEIQVLKELADFYFVMQEVPKVYCAITNDQLSKLMYDSDTVLGYFNELFYDKECTQEDIIDMIKGCTDLQELKKDLANYFDLEEKL